MTPTLRADRGDWRMVRVAHTWDVGASEVVDRVRPMHRHDIESPIGGVLVRPTHRTCESGGAVVGNGRRVHRWGWAGPRE